MEMIVYISPNGWKGSLYGWHTDPFCGGHYSMSIFDDTGKEVLHAYNAKPRTQDELKCIVERAEKDLHRLLIKNVK